MPRLLRNILVPSYIPSADEVRSFDLPVNPLSVVLLCLRPLNDTGTLANYARYRAICAALNRVTIARNGQNIISMRGEDIASFNWLRWGMQPWEANPDNVDNERRAVVLPIPLGRYPYHPTSCFPATKRGELTIELDVDIADTGYDGLQMSIETIELPDAKPKEFEKRTQLALTWPATGTNDMELPMGNLVRGILLFGTTGFAGAAPAPSWGRVKCLLDNVEAGFSNTDWEVLMADAALWGRIPNLAGDHKHTVDAAGAGIEQTTSVFDMCEDYTQYAYLDFDPTGDDTYSLDTKGANSFKLRAEAETADAVRAVVVESLKAM